MVSKALVAVLLIAVLGISVFAAVLVLEPALLSKLRGQDVLAVSNIYLEENGVHGSDGSLHGVDWRILATTGSSDMYFLQLNQSTLDSLGSKVSAPENVQVTGSTTFGAFQTQSPYWTIPVSKIKDVTVYPQITGSYGLGQASQYRVPAMEVSVWQTVPSQMRLVIPFSIGIVKTLGSNLGSFTTSYSGAHLETSGSGNYYTFSISAESLQAGELSPVIIFTNPNDAQETVKITLQFTVSSTYQFPTEPWVIITEKNGGEVSNNVFHYGDLQSILNILDYTVGNSWSYYHYLYGGGGIFKARGYASVGGNSVEYPNDMALSTWSDGSVCPSFTAWSGPPFSQTFTYVLAEGYCYPKAETNQHFQFPGWYVPDPQNNEGLRLGGEFWLYRLPLAGSIHNDLVNTRPVGLSLVNYLAYSLTYQGSVKPFQFQRVNLNYWGYGGEGDCPNGLKVSIPKGARQWLFSMDVSAEVVDTVVVVQNYIDVEISSFNVDRENVGKGQTATVTCTLRNKSNFAGDVSVGVSLPSSIAYSVETAGGTGLLHFSAAGQVGDTQQFTFTLRNTGNLAEDSGLVKLTLQVTNSEPRVTATRDFYLNFLQGLGVADTTLIVTTVDADSGDRISGLTVSVYYGQSMEDTVSPVSTTDGSATLNLGVYTGYAKIVVTDNGGRYEAQDKTVGPLNHGSNAFTFRMVLKGESPPLDDWLIYLIIIVVALFAIAIGAGAAQRKKR